MNRILRRAGIVLALICVAMVFSSIYVVPQAQQALVVRLGRPIKVITEPGPRLKVPFIDNVIYYYSGLLALQPPTEPVILGDQKRVEVDTFTEFRIADALRFNQTVQTEEQARSQLAQMVSSSLRRVLGQVKLPDLLSTDRDVIIRNIRQAVADAARPLGIDVVDVAIRRAGLPPETSQAIYDRMTSERQREAKELRAQGFEWAQEIQAKADRERSDILADAQLKASIAHAKGDADASALLADAFSRDPQFFQFYRAMQSYRRSLANAGPTLVLSPDSELLHYFNGRMPEPSKP